MSAFSKFIKLFSMAGGVRSNVNPLTRGIEESVGAKIIRRAYQPAVADAYLHLNDVPIQTGNTLAPIYVVYIDPVDGNDAWDGAAPAFTSGTTGPKKTIDTTAWTGTKTARFTNEVCLFRAGTTYIHQSATAPIAVASYQSIGAYWLPTEPDATLPILRSLNNNGAAGTTTRCVMEGSGTITNVTISDVVIDAQDVPNRHGLIFRQWGDNQTLNNITINNVHVINGVTNHNYWYSGINFNFPYAYSRTTAPATSTNILVMNCSAVGLGGFGFSTMGVFGAQLANGKWSGIDFINCTADGNGVYYDSHGFSSYSIGVNNLWTSGSWVNASGTIYYRDMSAQYGRSVWDIEICYCTDPTTEVFQLVKNTATPTTPAVGEFGFDPATQRMYVNMNAAITSGFQWRTCIYAAKGIRYINCEAKNTQMPGRSGTVEGIGIAMDDYTSYCSAFYCRSHANLGLGYSLNLGNNNLLVGCQSYGNGRHALGSIFGYGHKLVRCYFDSVFGVEQFAGAGFAGVGIWPASFKANTLQPSRCNNVLNCHIKWSGADTTVAPLSVSDSGSAPVTRVVNTWLDGPGPRRVGKRGHFIGRFDREALEPATVLGLGAS